jgi:alcohol dehydrogenase, propanol-preferring
MRGQRLAQFGKPLEKFESPTPAPQGLQVLLRVVATGICHSDLHICDGYYELGEGKRLYVAERGLALPIVLGHEVVGEVVAAGSETDAALIGEMRLIYPWLGCGACSICSRGESNRCSKPNFIGIHRPGGYADHVMVPSSDCLVPIGSLSPAEAAPFACSGVTAYGALKRIPSRILSEEPLIILGAGGLGLMALTLLTALGGRGAVVVEIDGAKRAEALRLGALAAVDGRAADLQTQILSAVGKAPAAVIDFVGSSATADLGIKLLDRGGQYVVVGLFGGAVTLPLALIAMRSIRIEGSNVGKLSELKELMALVCAANNPGIALHRSHLDQANQMLAALREGRIVGRAILQP